jgi:hypothetical protein
MPYVSIEHLQKARGALLVSGHPSVIVLLALCHDSATNKSRSASAAQTDILNRIFRVDGSDTLEWYVPLGEARGADMASARWRGSSKNYVGRSLQVMKKDLQDRGVYSIDDNVSRLAPNATELVQGYLEGKIPKIPLPIPVWPLATWRYRHDSIEDLNAATTQFIDEFYLKQLAGVFDLSPPPPELLELQLLSVPVEDASLINGLLEARPVTDGEGGEADEGVGFQLGIQLNPAGDVAAGGKPVQLLLHGCPGSGKSYKLADYSASAHYVFRTVVHPEARYADFIGGLRPRTAWKVEIPPPDFVGLDFRPPGEPRIIYEFQPGPLLQAYYLACFEPDRSVVLIIEELSRGNASQLFGDFLQLLDRLEEDSQGVPAGASVYSIDPRPEVKAWIIENDILPPATQRGQARLPPNLFLWATMNRADQNARQLDSAFLRRWTREHCSWRVTDGQWDGVEVCYAGVVISWGALRSAVNQRLTELPGVPEDKFIGPYFIPKTRLSQPAFILEDLWGYLWYEVLKTRASDFFSVGTFAELADNWNNGVGAPIGELASE